MAQRFSGLQQQHWRSRRSVLRAIARRLRVRAVVWYSRRANSTIRMIARDELLPSSLRRVLGGGLDSPKLALQLRVGTVALFFFSSRRRHTRCSRDWSSDVCSSDLKAIVHGHCHQKSFGAFEPVEQALRLVPGLEVETIESSCCGMAGAFGYGAETYDA